jgi:predicted metal-binding membrane protein
MIERSVASTATLALAGACWIVAIHQSSGMDMGASTDLGSFSFFVAAWASMMAAMMLPGAVPAVSRFVRADGRLRAVPQFVGSYLVVWTLVGLAVYALYRPHSTSIAGVLVIAAVVFAQKLLPPKASIDVPLALAIVGLGALILVAPATVPGLTPTM